MFNDSLGNADRPITVYTYRPVSWNQSGPVLIVMPGAGRDGQPSRDAWIPYADRYSCLLIVPEFSLHIILMTTGTTLGIPTIPLTGSRKRTGHIRRSSTSSITPGKSTEQQPPTYLLFGHSAGAQFVHRMVMLLPEARYSRAVAANAGVYMVPLFTVPYPFGLKDSPLPQSDLQKIFARKLIVMSGGSDTDPNDGSLASFPEAEAQGATRFDRARFYFTTAKEEAGRRNVPFNWEYHVVPGVGHSEPGMAGPSAERLFANS